MKQYKTEKTRAEYNVIEQTRIKQNKIKQKNAMK